MSATVPDWAALIQTKRELLESQIPAEWRIPDSIRVRAHRESTESAFALFDETTLLTKRERQLTESYDAKALLEHLANGSITSLEVTTAFCKRAAIAQQLINPLTEIFFDKALARARECDAHFSRYGKPMGAFHGLPISVKDMFMIEGEFATLGFVAYLQKPHADKNSVMVDLLLDHGAVLYCKTSVPQGLTTMESSNNIFGYTLNPHKMCLTSGGSSSGEGALLGFRGSPLGVGTDIGGSVRCPSLLNGIFGFKPTANRLPWSGQQFHFPDGWPGVVPAVGCHAHSARDLTFFCKSMIDAEGWKHDSTALYAPWRDVPRRKLNIGLWMGVEDLPIFPPVSRALKDAAEALGSAGHTVTAVDTPQGSNMHEVIQSYVQSLSLDNDHMLLKPLEEADEELTPMIAGIKAQSDAMGAATLSDVWQSNISRDRLRQAWHAAMRKDNLDVILCPGHRAPGSIHNTYGVPYYTMIWNLLNVPASVLPYVKADKTIDAQEMKDYDLEMMDQVPCGVQLVGWTGQDEEVLMATEVVADVLHESRKRSQL